jgi:hypothetical protein
MTTLQSSADIVADILFRAGEPTDGTSDFDAEALRCLNRAYRAIWQGGGEFVKSMNEPWLWLKKDPPGTLTLNPIITSGTVSVTNNSTTATLSASMTPSLAGRYFQVAGLADVFRVQAHTSGTTGLTLDSVYTGPTSGTAGYQISQLEYTLAADILRLISPMRVYQEQERIEGIDLEALDRDYPLSNIETGTPTRFAYVTESKIRFNKAGGLTSTDLRRVDYDYLAKPSDLLNDSTEPVVPLHHRQVLADIALFYLFTSKNDDRAAAIGTQAKAGLQAMASDNRARVQQLGRIHGKLTPRLDRTGRFQRVLRTSSGFIIG